MSTMTYGITAVIDGPPPVPRPYGLLQAARAPAAGVTIETETDELGIERWPNGVGVWPYPSDEALTYDQCSTASPTTTKEEGTLPESPIFASFAVYLPVTCTTRGIGDLSRHAEFRERARLTFETIEGRAVERELAAADLMPDNPNLADGNGVFPNADAATSVQNGIALLEGEIAATGRLGVIHVPPEVATMASGLSLKDDGGVLKTINGTPVIPGAGYSPVGFSGPIEPPGHASPGDNQHWIFATGPVEIRRSQLSILPDTPAEALDRGLGASLGADNTVTYRVERYYLAIWDVVLQAAVLVDRCSTDC